MGKKQHQSDKLYVTSREWKESFGGHKDNKDTRVQRAEFKRLPFTHCALTFLPFKKPVCTPEGTIFDKEPLLAYITRNGINPVNGKKLPASQLVDLKFSLDSDGNFQCPVTFRTFTPFSLIVAIRTTGNVYSMDAVEELNLKRSHLKDLLTDVPFKRSDIITLQDPNDVEKFNMEKFYHVQFDTRTQEQIAEEKRQMESPSFFLNKVTGEAKLAIDKLNEKYVAKKNEVEKVRIADKLNAAHYSQGKVSAGFTSTTLDPATNNESAVLEDDEVKYSRVTKNGFVRINTNHGPLNLELFCKIAPKACENFIVHCKNNYYDKSKFHRSIKHFMLQGGAPANTGKDGESIWGKPFKDEINGSLKHDARGVLSMANKGSDTNQSQFFITYRPATHLNGKHTIFGKLVGGATTLSTIEQIKTNDKDVPLEPVIFESAEVFVDPFAEAEGEIAKERAALDGKVEPKISAPQLKSDGSSKFPKPKVHGSGVGKYIKPDLKVALKRVTEQDSTTDEEPQKKLAPRPFSDFSEW